MPPGTLLPAAATPRVQTAFCSSDGSGFLAVQPADQLERWSPMIDNGTHLVIDWRADPRLCGRNVTAYFVEVSTSTQMLNFFIGRFGSFPQDLCAPGGSKARAAVEVEEEQPVCSPYEAWCARKARRTAFEIPSALLQLLKLDVEVTVRAYGSHAPPGRPHEAVAAPWWCHKYRRVGRADSAEEVAVAARRAAAARKRGLSAAALTVGAAAAAAAATVTRAWPGDGLARFGAFSGSALTRWRPSLDRLATLARWRPPASLSPRPPRWRSIA